MQTTILTGHELKIPSLDGMVDYEAVLHRETMKNKNDDSLPRSVAEAVKARIICTMYFDNDPQYAERHGTLAARSIY